MSHGIQNKHRLNRFTFNLYTMLSKPYLRIKWNTIEGSENDCTFIALRLMLIRHYDHEELGLDFFFSIHQATNPDDEQLAFDGFDDRCNNESAVVNNSYCKSVDKGYFLFDCCSPSLTILNLIWVITLLVVVVYSFCLDRLLIEFFCDKYQWIRDDHFVLRLTFWIFLSFHSLSFKIFCLNLVIFCHNSICTVSIKK